MDLIVFPPHETVFTGAQRVWTRATWDQPWKPQPYLHCVEANWSCAPTMPTAAFVWNYGLVAQMGESTVRHQEKVFGKQREYVKVEFQTRPDPNHPQQWLTRTWYGVIEAELDDMLGADPSPPNPFPKNLASGHQTWNAYGLEILLALHVIQKSHFLSGGTVKETMARLSFNARSLPNRSPNLQGNSYVFEPDATVAKPWSTRDIASYLIDRHSPRAAGDAKRVPFRLNSDDTKSAPLPNWDRPEISLENVTLYGLLNRLIDLRRLYLWWLTVDETTTPHDVVVNCNTLAKNDIPINAPGADPIPANKRKVWWSFDQDQLTVAQVRDSDVQRYDVVRMLGAPEIHVGTFSRSTNSLQKAWTGPQQTDYEYGAALDPGYQFLTTKNKQKALEAFRSNPRLENVFSAFRLPDTWDLHLDDGEGNAVALFPGPSNGTWDVYLADCFLEHDLPLLIGVDYGADKIKNGIDIPKDATDHLGPLLFFRRPEGTWVRGEEIGKSANKPITEPTRGEFNHLSVHVHVKPKSRTVLLKVSGAPQHAIAFDEFTRSAVDPAIGKWSTLTGMVVTLALPSGRRLFGQWPPAEPNWVDAVRVKEIDAGEHFSRYYVAPGTVVGIKPDGSLLQSTGGWVPKPGPDDAETQLKEFAKVAGHWYTSPHFALHLETRRLREDLGLGDLITDVGDFNVPGGHQRILNSPITEISFSLPLAAQPTPPTMRVVTFAGELDPLTTGPLSLDSEEPFHLKRKQILKL